MSEANERQVGGNYYSKAGKDEQHWDRVARLGLDYFQAQVTKYVERCWDKNGIEDLKKAVHFLQKYIEVCEAAGKVHGKQSAKLEQFVAFIKQANERLRQENAELVNQAGRAPLQLDWLLLNVVVREDGQITTPDGMSHHCLQGHGLNIGLDFTFEGAYGGGRTMWTCMKCRDKVYTQGAQLPHAVHRSCKTVDLDAPCTMDTSEPHPHGYVDQDGGDLTAGLHTVVLSGPHDKPTS